MYVSYNYLLGKSYGIHIKDNLFVHPCPQTFYFELRLEIAKHIITLVMLYNMEVEIIFIALTGIYIIILVENMKTYKHK